MMNRSHFVTDNNIRKYNGSKEKQGARGFNTDSVR